MKFDFEAFSKEVHEVSKKAGWWDRPHKTPLECMALVVAEVAEVMEELRLDPPNPPIYQLQSLDWIVEGMKMVTPKEADWDPSCKTEGQAAELADVILRILDYCEYHKLPLIEALQLKHSFNQTRPYRHGKKL